MYHITRVFEASPGTAVYVQDQHRVPSCTAVQIRIEVNLALQDTRYYETWHDSSTRRLGVAPAGGATAGGIGAREWRYFLDENDSMSGGVGCRYWNPPCGTMV